MTTNRQISEWKKEAIAAELTFKKVSFSTMKADELYTKWKTAVNLRRTILTALCVLANLLLLASLALSYSISPVLAFLAIVLTVASDIGFSILWSSEYCRAADIEKQVENLTESEMIKFNYWAHDLPFHRRPFYEDDLDKPTLLDYAGVAAVCGFFSIIIGYIMITAIQS